MKEENIKRCQWSNLEKSQTYMKYHDEEWGVASYDDRYLFEMFVLESFHCGLSWLIILNKRQAFKDAFDNFDPLLVSQYDENKIEELRNNANIIRHIGKIRASVANAKAFLKVQAEFSSFSQYIWSFTDNKVLYSSSDEIISRNELSDKVAKDLKKRGFKFMGSVTAFSYLEAIGIMNNHASYCSFCSKDKK